MKDCSIHPDLIKESCPTVVVSHQIEKEGCHCVRSSTFSLCANSLGPVLSRRSGFPYFQTSRPIILLRELSELGAKQQDLKSCTIS